MPTLVLLVNGSNYEGWKTARVTRSMEAISGSFELEYFDRWAGSSWSHPIFREAGCKLMYGEESLVSGVIDGLEGELGAEEHTLKISGRDLTAAMVDSSPNVNVWEFSTASVETIARAMAEPFGIKVAVAKDLGQLPQLGKVAVDPGETAFQVLDKVCRMAAVLPISDGNGGIVLSRGPTGRANCHLVQGENVLKASASVSMKDRFRIYRVMGQRPGTPSESVVRTAGYSDAGASKPASWKKARSNKPNSVTASAEDLQVQRTDRMKVIHAEAGLTLALAQRRAEWERDVRAARSEVVTVTVQGWTQAPGRYGSNERLWQVNELVGVSLPILGLDSTELLITAVDFEFSRSNGTTATLTLKRPDAFAPEPIAGMASGLWPEIAKGVQGQPKAGTADTFRSLR